MLAFICIYMTSLLGIYLIYKYKNISNFGLVIIYGIITTISNLISATLCRFMYNMTEGIESRLNYDTSYFVRYVIINLTVSFVISLLYVLITKAVKVSITDEKSTKRIKKNSKNSK